MNGSRARRSQRDNSLVAAIGLLIFVGMIVIYTISPALNFSNIENTDPNYFVYRHIVNLVLGVIAFYFGSKLPIEWWKKTLPVMVGVVVVSTVLLLFPQTSITAGGATRWVDLGFFSFQPSEIIKFTALVYTAFFLSNRSDDELNAGLTGLMPIGVLLAVAGVLVVILQRDLSTMIVITLMIGGMLYFRGVSAKLLMVIASGLLVLGVLAVALFPYRTSRLTSFISAAECDGQRECYQLDQSLTAIGSGGAFGVGIGRSEQIYGYLPEAENDSVFAIYGEIFGFFGTVALVALFGYVLWRLLMIAEQQKTITGRLFAGGITVWLAAHVLINVGAMTGLMPLTGITLPFLSYGGSSLIVMLGVLGIAYQLSSSSNTVGGGR